eukprot:TRINITY_DN13767_c0_g2_i1.p1 TRINITY_DN13767_c0_g2~~TRINITY_DN13767_c0_g2_i1.p1  ORF type:complete len:138 (-),score=13.64 TRINITY_DN13767_c0_g2_i1:52-465(-)
MKKKNGSVSPPPQAAAVGFYWDPTSLQVSGAGGAARLWRLPGSGVRPPPTATTGWYQTTNETTTKRGAEAGTPHSLCEGATKHNVWDPWLLLWVGCVGSVTCRQTPRAHPPRRQKKKKNNDYGYSNQHGDPGQTGSR